MGSLKKLVVSAAMVVSVVAGSSGVIATTFASSVRANDDSCASTFFGLPAWYRGLTSDDGQCNIISPSELDKDGEESGTGLTSFIWTIVLNIIQALLMLVGYASAVFLIVGGFRYITAAGSADMIKSAKDTIRNAIVGMVISLSAVAIVNVIVQAIL